MPTTVRTRLGRRALFILALAAWVPALGAQTRVMVLIRGYQTPVMLDALGAEANVSAPADKVYAAALAVFGDLGIPVNTKDPAKGIVAATRFIKMHALAG